MRLLICIPYPSLTHIVVVVDCYVWYDGQFFLASLFATADTFLVPCFLWCANLNACTKQHIVVVVLLHSFLALLFEILSAIAVVAVVSNVCKLFTMMMLLAIDKNDIKS